MAASALATPTPESLCVWMPTAHFICLTISAVTRATSPGIVPPLVSHRTTMSTPESCAALSVAIAYRGSSLYPSKKCSASYTTSLPCSLKKRTESPIIARFSSGVVRMTSATCSDHVLPTSVTTGVFALTSMSICGSSLHFVFARRVLPKAATFACLNLRLAASVKKSMSLGFEPGQPPSM